VGPGQLAPFSVVSGEIITVLGGSTVSATTPMDHFPVINVINGEVILDGTQGNAGPNILINNPATPAITHADGIDVNSGNGTGGTPASFEIHPGTVTTIETTGSDSYGVWASAHGVPGASTVKMDNATNNTTVTITTQGSGSAAIAADHDADVALTNTHAETIGG
jgi:hypothetical protein